MAFMTKADKAAVQSMQTDEKGMREIERARKNKGKRVRGRSISPERAAQFKSLQQEYDQQVIEQNFKDNNKVLIEAGLEPMTWEEIYGDKIQEHATSREAAEHYIEIVVDDDHCRVMISDDGFNRGQKFMTALGKGKTLRSGQEIYWNLPPKAFKFGGKGYSILKIVIMIHNYMLSGIVNSLNGLLFMLKLPTGLRIVINSQRNMAVVRKTINICCHHL